MIARLTIATLLLMSGSVVLCLLFAQEPSESQAGFENLMSRASARADDLDFTALRIQWAEQDEYNPYLDISDLYTETIPALDKDLAAKRYGDAVERCRSTAHLYKLDLKWNLRCRKAYRGFGDADAAAFHDYMVSGLIRSIMNSGDGKTPETAYKVITIAEEYAVFAVLEVAKTSQSLVEIEGLRYDEIIVKDKNTAEKSTLYFQIEPVFRWLERN